MGQTSHLPKPLPPRPAPREDLSFPEAKIPKNFTATPTPPIKPRPRLPASTNPFEVVPPHSPEIEKCALGSILADPTANEYAGQFLKPEDFYVPRNRALFKKCREV